MTSTQQEIERLAGMTMPQLRETYAELFGETTRSGNWRWLFRRCAWRVQALAEGGLPERVRRRALEMADDADARVIPPREALPAPGGRQQTEPVALDRDDRLPGPGVTLEREFKGEVHYVKVLPNGFEHKGTFHRSLSAVAYAISGSHWNGYKFFHKALDFAKEAAAND